MRIEKILLGFLVGLLMVSAASAALVTLQAPTSVDAGDTLTLTIDNTVKAGTTTDLVLYSADYTKREINRWSITFQGKPYTKTISTEGFAKGIYRFELVDPTGDTFGGSSKTWAQFEVINRSSELTITTPSSQLFDGTLNIAGSVKDLEDRGVQITVENGNGVVFGPEYIASTSNGAFMKEVPITEAGAYRVRFDDYKGYITTLQFIVYPVANETTVPTTVAPTPTTPESTTIPTQTATPTSTPQTPLPATLALLAIGFAAMKRFGR
ncbi:MAG TPA: hypothetical protein VE134_01655 [Methanomicrobiales archaeon]|nr:hypothetical protein [Methanomicrobiales archaeon]